MTIPDVSALSEPALQELEAAIFARRAVIIAERNASLTTEQIEQGLDKFAEVGAKAWAEVNTEHDCADLMCPRCGVRNRIVAMDSTQQDDCDLATKLFRLQSELQVVKKERDELLAAQKNPQQRMTETLKTLGLIK